MLFIKIIVQILLDLVKAIPLFCLVALVQQIAFPTDWVVTFVTFFCPLWLLVSLYGLGFLFASFSFVFTKFPVLLASLLTGFSFGGFQEQSSHLIATLTRFLPFHLLVSFIRQPSWFVLYYYWGWFDLLALGLLVLSNLF